MPGWRLLNTTDCALSSVFTVPWLGCEEDPKFIGRWFDHESDSVVCLVFLAIEIHSPLSILLSPC